MRKQLTVVQSMLIAVAQKRQKDLNNQASDADTEASDLLEEAKKLQAHATLLRGEAQAEVGHAVDAIADEYGVNVPGVKIKTAPDGVRWFEAPIPDPSVKKPEETPPAPPKDQPVNGAGQEPVAEPEENPPVDEKPEALTVKDKIKAGKKSRV